MRDEKVRASMRIGRVGVVIVACALACLAGAVTPRPALALRDKGIRIASPKAGDVWMSGHDVKVRYVFTRRVGPGSVIFELRPGPGARPVVTEKAKFTSPPDPPGRFIEKVMVLHLPPNLPAGTEYRIVARHPEAGGESDPFSVNVFGDGGGSTSSSEPVDLWLIGLFTSPRQKIIARIRASENFVPADWVQVRSSHRYDTFRVLVRAGDNEVEIADVSTWDCTGCGVNFEVTLDPGNGISERNEANNSVSQRVYCRANQIQYGVEYGGQDGGPSTTFLIPCDSLEGQSLRFTARNCGFEKIQSWPTLVDVRQVRSGSRAFDEAAPHTYHVAVDAQRGDWVLGRNYLDPGDIGIVHVELSDLRRMDSTLDFNLTGRLAWYRTRYQVNLDFGASVIHTRGGGTTCEYGD